MVGNFIDVSLASSWLLTVLLMVYRNHGRYRTGLFPSSLRRQPEFSTRKYSRSVVTARALDERGNPSAVGRKVVRKEDTNQRNGGKLSEPRRRAAPPMERHEEALLCHDRLLVFDELTSLVQHLVRNLGGATYGLVMIVQSL
jgi:hypothetical protein